MRTDDAARQARTTATQPAASGTQPQDVRDQAQQAATQVADQAQQKTGQVAEQVKQQVSSRLSGQIERTSDGLGSVSQALGGLSRQLREQDQAVIAEYADRTAAQVDRAAGYLRGKDLDQLIDEAERFARRQPVAFVGGAFALGLLASRFLKSSRQRAAAEADPLALPPAATLPGQAPPELGY